MSFLLDTNAISESSRLSPNPGFAAWLEAFGKPESREGRVSISVLTIAELKRGILRRKARRDPIERWSAFLEAVLQTCGSNILPVTLSVASQWAILAETNRANGVSVGVIDEMLAATALVHDLTVVTRNVRHFEHSGCKLLSPWSE
ncbi:type II toxin-antitoxin system VapC family toxin [Brevundimonas sp. AJA228-03]|uniref:type II toxin-antitoxin system VapC family toxin n=1 Tax=Brevundimonas sp. AJA228-03 TaxID=2752515 RepID=UPI001ADFDF30|nr:type II toxin-antitoxin system VapC family toxin [Brevundimonas sp. AJA228-03]QTN19795.1 type II toxin-antitoxin system VapC family toxin [Brevundimonas sp. AJA228-03]